MYCVVNKKGSNNTCILYFTTGNRGTKTFSSKKEKSNSVQRLLFAKTLKEIRNTKLDFKISDGVKYGNNPLEKLNGAIADVFSAGYESLIIVGDDTPQLSASHIREANLHLKNGYLTIGPSKDGGTYLIAFNQTDFDNGILKDIHWHSEHFLDEILTNCALQGSDFEFLPEFADIDYKLDLLAFIRENKVKSFVKALQNLLYSFKQSIKKILYFFTVYFENCIDRGPPRFIFN